MLRFDSGHGVVDRVLYSEEGRSGLMLIDSVYLHQYQCSPTSNQVATSWMFGGFGVCVFTGNCGNRAIVATSGEIRQSEFGSKFGSIWIAEAAPNAKRRQPKPNMCYIRAFEEVVYQPEFSELIPSLLARDSYLEMHEDDVLASFSIGLVALGCPFSDLRVFCAHKHCQKNIYFEVCRRLPSCCVQSFAAFNNVVDSALPPADLVSLFILGPPW